MLLILAISFVARKVNFTQYGSVYVLRSIRHEHIANDEAGANLNSRVALEESPEMVMMTTVVALSRFRPTGRRGVCCGTGRNGKLCRK